MDATGVVGRRGFRPIVGVAAAGAALAAGCNLGAPAATYPLTAAGAGRLRIRGPGGFR